MTQLAIYLVGGRYHGWQELAAINSPYDSVTVHDCPLCKRMHVVNTDHWMGPWRGDLPFYWLDVEHWVTYGREHGEAEYVFADWNTELAVLTGTQTTLDRALAALSLERAV